MMLRSCYHSTSSDPTTESHIKVVSSRMDTLDLVALGMDASLKRAMEYRQSNCRLHGYAGLSVRLRSYTERLYNHIAQKSPYRFH